MQTASSASFVCSASLSASELDRHSLYSHLTAGTDDTHCNLSPVCDQYFFNHLSLHSYAAFCLSNHECQFCTDYYLSIHTCDCLADTDRPFSPDDLRLQTYLVSRNDLTFEFYILLIPPKYAIFPLFSSRLKIANRTSLCQRFHGQYSRHHRFFRKMSGEEFFSVRHTFISHCVFSRYIILNVIQQKKWVAVRDDFFI